MNTERNFFKNSGPYKLSEIVKLTNFKLEDDLNDQLIYEIRSLKEAGANDLSFLTNKKYANDFVDTKAAACIVPLDFSMNNKQGTILLKAANPYAAYQVLVNMFYSSAKLQKPQIMPSAQIAKNAIIGDNCYVGHNVVIEEEVEIGNNCVIESGSFIDYRVKIGNRCRIDNNVSISHSIIGDDVVILPGARIGQDGFGFASSNGVHKKIYHTGRVIIGNDVEIGANSCIDRGSMSDTIIEDFCRIDNLVQIGHNVIVKKGAILVAQVGIAGSSKIGSYCALGGQVGIAGHVTIADKVQIAGQGGVAQDITESGKIMGGSPAVPIRDWHKQTIILKNLIKEK